MKFGWVLIVSLFMIFAGCTPKETSNKNADNNLNGQNFDNNLNGQNFGNNFNGINPPPTWTPTVTATPTSTYNPPGAQPPAFYQTLNCTGSGVNRPWDGVTFPPPENRTPWCRVIQGRGREVGLNGVLIHPGNWNSQTHYVDGAACQNYNTTAYPGITNQCELAFVSDVDMSFRFKVLKVPNGCDSDGDGYVDYIQQAPKPYNYLKFNVKVFEKDNPFNLVAQFNDVVNLQSLNDRMPNNGASQYRPQYTNIFSVPSGALGNVSKSLMFEISEVRSDYGCDFTGGYYYCPVEWTIPGNGCWAIEVQVATDSTQSFN